jgi:glycosyltransferase involved in cell wall biosynthesis
MPEKQTLSLIVPAYDEVESAQEIIDFYREICAAHTALHIELVVVDDGSTDGTSQAVISAAAPGEDVNVVELSRNFGSHAAISAGLAQCTGDAALTLSADRQEPLSAVTDFVSTWQAGADIVWGLRSVRARKTSADALFGRLFSSVFHAVSVVPTYPSEGPSQILLTRPVIDVLNAMPEAHRNVLAMAAWTGFDQRRIQFEQMPRPHGTSRWTPAKKVKLVVDSLVEFSSAPIRWIELAGAAASMLGLLLMLAAAVQALVPDGADGFRLVVCGLVLVLGGAQLFAIGVVGEYVWRAGDDARRRPLSIVRAVRRVRREPVD